MNYIQRFDDNTGGWLKRARNHLKRNRMSYGEHLLFAAKHGGRCIKAGGMLLVHSIFPCFFRRAGSKLVYRMAIDFTEVHSRELEEEK